MLGENERLQTGKSQGSNSVFMTCSKSLSSLVRRRRPMTITEFGNERLRSPLFEARAKNVKFLMLIISVRVKIQLKERSLDSF